MVQVNLFQKTRELERKIADFLTNITQAGVLFGAAIQAYLESGVTESFSAKRAQVSLLESSNDTLRRDVESQLYTHMILPDMRSDIMKIIEGCDAIINKYESDLILMSVEKPKVPKELIAPLIEMIHLDLDCVNALVDGVRAFFSATQAGDHVQYVLFLEHQIDDLALELKRLVFENKNLPLARQLQLKEFIYSIEKISDMAEDVADVLTVILAKHAV